MPKLLPYIDYSFVNLTKLLACISIFYLLYYWDNKSDCCFCPITGFIGHFIFAPPFEAKPLQI